MSDNPPIRDETPPWSRDELILALDLYVRHEGNPPGKGSAEILALSSLTEPSSGTASAATQTSEMPTAFT